MSRSCLLAVSAALVCACSELTKVSAPDLIQPHDLNTPSGAVTRRAGAIAAFANAYTNEVFVSGLLSDELTDRTGGGGFQFVDRRVVDATRGRLYPYDSFSAARINLLRAIVSLEAYAPMPGSRVSELFSLLGYIETIFVEDMCAGVPLASLSNDVPVSGTPLTRGQMLQHALADFDSAAAHAAGDSTALSLASIGRGRALVDSGALSAAAVAVHAVPTSFAYVTIFSDSLYPSNQLATIFNGLAVSVSDREGANGLPYVTRPDPRTPLVNLGPGGTGDSVYALATQLTLGSALTLASGVEARLIEAESALRSENAAGWTALLNALRQSFPDTALSNHPLTVDSTGLASDALRLAVHFRERAEWLFATGHRTGDLRRLVRQYQLPVDGTFPTGPYQNTGLQYGSDVTFVPFGEPTNTGTNGCSDRSP